MNWITGLLLLVLSYEVPDIEQARRDDHRASVQELGRINHVVTHEHSTLVNPDVDMALLAAVQYYEGRYWVQPDDGDCLLRLVRNERVMRRVCSAVGPMQIHTQATRWLLRWETEIKWATIVDGKPVTAKKLREPIWNVRAGYEIIRHWKHLCGGVPGVWLTAYGWGRCPKKGYVDREGGRRCALATAILERAGKLPQDWKCGHKGRKQWPRERQLLSHVATAAL